MAFIQKINGIDHPQIPASAGMKYTKLIALKDIYYPQIPACAGSRSYISGMRCDIYHLQIPAVAGISNLTAAIIRVHQIPADAGTCKCFLLSKCGIYRINTCYCRLVTLYMLVAGIHHH